jgi:hypothetical protein
MTKLDQSSQAVDAQDRSEEAIPDLQPKDEDAESVTGGTGHCASGQHIPDVR